jgi:hypothetical protein
MMIMYGRRRCPVAIKKSEPTSKRTPQMIKGAAHDQFVIMNDVVTTKAKKRIQCQSKRTLL